MFNGRERLGTFQEVYEKLRGKRAVLEGLQEEISEIDTPHAYTLVDDTITQLGKEIKEIEKAEVFAAKIPGKSYREAD